MDQNNEINETEEKNKKDELQEFENVSIPKKKKTKKEKVKTEEQINIEQPILEDKKEMESKIEEEKKEEIKLKEEEKIIKIEDKKEELKLIKDISNKSTKEDVAGFFKFNMNINDDICNNIIKEYITGDILPDLSINDLKYLGLQLEDIINWNKYYDENEDNFKEDEIKEEISANSTSEEVKQFLLNFLDFKDNVNNLNGGVLLKLNDEDMKKLGMKLGQRKQLIKYINHFSKKVDKDIYSGISEYSSESEVDKFLKEKLNISEETINDLGFDNAEGLALFLLNLMILLKKKIFLIQKKKAFVNSLKKLRKLEMKLDQ